MPLDPLLIEVLACPEDKGPAAVVRGRGPALQPAAQARATRCVDSIPVMLIDESIAVDDAEHDRLWPRPRPAARRDRAAARPSRRGA